MPARKLTYKESGVDTKTAAALVGDIGSLRSSTEKKRKLYGAFGLFAAAYDLSSYKEPVIVTGCDGVGTKLELLLQHDLLETAGKDLVAMNVNDVLTTGGDPILFLDYLGIPKIDKRQISRLIAGMTEWLSACDCILAGGETAEMPGIVPEGVVEMSGFAIGVVEKPKLIQPERVAPGDAVIGFPSDGFHANGWSLVRRVLRENPKKFTKKEIVAMLAPTRLYHQEVRALRKARADVRAMAHITGGGLTENLERFLGNKGADLTIPAWKLGAIPRVLSFCEPADQINTFNMGWGWVVIVPQKHKAKALAAGPGARELGVITDSPGVHVTVSR
jgi:phosphoribosylformylglycinamidine cyclo-ligase